MALTRETRKENRRPSRERVAVDDCDMAPFRLPVNARFRKFRKGLVRRFDCQTAGRRRTLTKPKPFHPGFGAGWLTPEELEKGFGGDVSASPSMDAISPGPRRLSTAARKKLNACWSDGAERAPHLGHVPLASFFGLFAFPARRGAWARFPGPGAAC